MSDEHNKERRDLTFSQREGKASLPELLQVGKLTKEFRNFVWLFIERSISECTEMAVEGIVFSESSEGRYWKTFLFKYQFSVLHIPHDEIHVTKPPEVREWLKNLILRGKNHEVLTVLEYMLRISSIPQKLTNNIESCFSYAPYLIDRSSKPICIFPTTSKEMKESIKQSLVRINESTLTGARSHFKNASQELRKNDFAASIRESIHAVESAARQIDPKNSNSLDAALNSLEKSGMLKHPALRKGFNKLYDYTSDEEGIRHSLLDKEAADVGFDEAIFMYGACVSFVDYLASKHKQSEEK